jgi:hypothetical protein
VRYLQAIDTPAVMMDLQRRHGTNAVKTGSELIADKRLEANKGHT